MAHAKFIDAKHREFSLPFRKWVSCVHQNLNLHAMCNFVAKKPRQNYSMCVCVFFFMNYKCYTQNFLLSRVRSKCKLN